MDARERFAVENVPLFSSRQVLPAATPISFTVSEMVAFAMEVLANTPVSISVTVLFLFFALLPFCYLHSKTAPLSRGGAVISCLSDYFFRRNGVMPPSLTAFPIAVTLSRCKPIDLTPTIEKTLVMKPIHQ